MGPHLIGSLGSSCRTRDFYPALAALVREVVFVERLIEPNEGPSGAGHHFIKRIESFSPYYSKSLLLMDLKIPFFLYFDSQAASTF